MEGHRPRKRRALSLPQRAGPAADELDRAHAGGTAASGEIRRPDGLRGFSPLSEPEGGDLTVRVATSLKAVPAGAWNACANPHALLDAVSVPGSARPDLAIDRDNPFVSHEFLTSLEESRCTGGRSGWSPAYLVVEDGAGQILAAAPSFLKSHSQGEYVFDHGWADAYERAGGRYYPKLQVAAPFTPATGPRLLVADGPRAEEARTALIAGLEALRAQTQASSVHVTFAQEPDIAALKQAGY